MQYILPVPRNTPDVLFWYLDCKIDIIYVYADEIYIKKYIAQENNVLMVT